jgi:ATP-dependent RNA helicase DDX56/DBP9
MLTRGSFVKDIEELKQLILRKPAILKLEEAKETANQLTQYVIKYVLQGRSHVFVYN